MTAEAISNCDTEKKVEQPKTKEHASTARAEVLQKTQIELTYTISSDMDLLGWDIGLVVGGGVGSVV
jgi:hypothetical protein